MRKDSESGMACVGAGFVCFWGGVGVDMGFVGGVSESYAGLIQEG